MQTHDNCIVLIDGFSLIYRGFHAIPSLTNQRGEPTNALFAFARFLLNIESGVEHSHGAVVLDKGPPAERLKIYPEYKANRPPMPEELNEQMPAIREWTETAGWQILEKEGAEADDIIAAVSYAREDHIVKIVSADKDLAQLVSDEKVIQFIPEKNKKLKRLDSQEIEQKYGIRPEQMVDYLALLGDASDNVLGIEGVGKKTAASLLQQFGDIDSLLDNLEKVENDRLKHKLADAVDTLSRNRRVIRLERSLPDTWEGIQALKRRPPDWNRLIEMARDNNLKSLISALEQARNDNRNPTLF